MAADILDAIFPSGPVLKQNGHGAVAGLKTNRVAEVEYQSEKPWMRTAAYLASIGQTQMEIAKACDKSVGAVSLLAKQPWWRQKVAEFISEMNIGEAASAMLRAAVPGAIMRVVELSESSSVDSVRLKASQDILDRTLGKAPTRMPEANPKMAPEEEALYLEREIQRLSTGK